MHHALFASLPAHLFAAAEFVPVSVPQAPSEPPTGNACGDHLPALAVQCCRTLVPANSAETSIITGALFKVELNGKDKINHCQVIAAKSTTEMI